LFLCAHPTTLGIRQDHLSERVCLNSIDLSTFRSDPSLMGQDQSHVTRYLCISFTTRNVRWTTGKRESKEGESHVVNTPSDRREVFSERSKIYAFVRTSPPEPSARGVGHGDKRADPQRRLALRPDGMVLRHLPVPWPGARTQAENRHPGPLAATDQRPEHAHRGPELPHRGEISVVFRLVG